MPLLYSPLYQSIRLILFGALSLTGLAVSAAEFADTNPQIAAPLAADSPNLSANVNSDNVYFDNSYNTATATKAVKIDTKDDNLATDYSVTRTIVAKNSSSTNNDKLPTNDNSFVNSGTDTDFVDTNIAVTTINDSAREWSPENPARPLADNVNKQAANSSLIPKAVARADKKSTTNNAKANKRLNVKDESIQDSLVRLAEFYELTPDSKFDDKIDNQPIISNNVNNDTNVNAEQATPIQPLGTNLRLLPNTVDSAPRCEGQWVYPKNNPNYQRAVNDANANLNGAAGSNNLNAMPNNQAALFAEADYGYYDNIDYAELSGNVIIDQGSQHIEADKVVLDLTTGVAGAQGKVMFTDQAGGNSNRSANGTPTTTLPNFGNNPNGSSIITEEASQGGLIGVADSLAYSTENGQSTAYGVAFASVPLQAHGYAERLNRPNDSQYELDNVMFSTCPPTDRKWQLEAKSIDLDTDSGRGKAYDTTFRIADVPVFYLPYFNFPIDNRRSSGFLLPSASIGSKSGIEIDVPYYLNLSPNYDATINTHIYSNRNPMLSGEFRYLTDQYGEGIFNGSYLPNDKEYDGEDRSSFFYDHYWSSNSIPRLSGDAKYSYVSDAAYLNDFDTLGLSDNTLNLPRRARLNYYNDYVDGELKVETFQTLDAFTNAGEALQDKDKPYSRLPQLTLNYRVPWSDTIDITGTHDSAYFKKSIDDGSEDEKSGVRVYNKLSAAYPLEKAWGYIEPKVSLQHLYTSYDQDSLFDNELSKEEGSQSVFVPQASIDAGLYLYRAGSPFGAFDNTMGGYQMLSPRLKYSYSPYKDQNDIPNFNTRIASINYEQLFSDSWFLGHDRLQDLHAITPGINYRYIDATGVTRFDGSIAEQFYIDDGRVTLENEEPVFTTSSSGMVWDTSFQPYNNLWLDVSGALNSDYDLNFVTTELRYQPSNNSLFNVGFVKRQLDENTNQLPLSALTASAIFPINNNWRVLAQGQYDYRSEKMLDTLVGIDYEDCCFGFAVYGRRYYNDLNVRDKPNQAVMAEIRLNGLGSSKSRLTSLLSDKILGFEPVQNAWKD